jgi:hypothetical protein
MRSEVVSVKEVSVSLSRSPLRLKILLVFTPFRRVRCHIVLFDARTGDVRKREWTNCASAFACSEVQPLTPGRPSPVMYRTRECICHSLASVARGVKASCFHMHATPGLLLMWRSNTAAELVRSQYACHWKPGWSCVAGHKTPSNVAMGLEKRVGKLSS